MMDHSKVYRSGFLNQPKGTWPEMAPIDKLSFFNGKWPMHAASGNFLINEICNVLWMNLGGRECRIFMAQDGFRMGDEMGNEKQ